MKDYALKKPIDKNQLDNLTDALVNAMRYNDPSVIYPDVEAAKPNDGVEPEWFYPIYMGTNDFFRAYCYPYVCWSRNQV